MKCLRISRVELFFRAGQRINTPEVFPARRIAPGRNEKSESEEEGDGRKTKVGRGVFLPRARLRNCGGRHRSRGCPRARINLTLANRARGSERESRTNRRAHGRQIRFQGPRERWDCRACRGSTEPPAIPVSKDPLDYR